MRVCARAPVRACRLRVTTWKRDGVEDSCATAVDQFFLGRCTLVSLLTKNHNSKKNMTIIIIVIKNEDICVIGQTS